MICCSVLFILYLAVSVMAKTLASSTTQAEPTPSTVIDILSSKAEYSYFLRQLQINGMVPVVNSLRNITLLAPVNSAYAREEEANMKLEGNALSRYIIDQKVRVEYLGKSEAIFATHYHDRDRTYYLKIAADLDAQEYVVDGIASIVETDIYAKHQHSFVQSIDHLLDLKPSVCHLLLDRETNELQGYPIYTFKSLFHSLFTSVLDYEDVHNRETEINACQQFLRKTGTILIPSDNVFKKFMTDIEIRYYMALIHSLANPAFDTTREAKKEIKNDIVELLNKISLIEPVVGLNITRKHSYESLSKGAQYKITPKKESQIVINDAVESVGNNSCVVFSDTVVHLFDSTSVNFFGGLKIELARMIPRKSLYALHFSKFVKELHFRSLEKFIDGSVSNQTILLELSQKDDVLETETHISSFSSKQGILYQFIDNYIDIGKLLSDSEHDAIYLLEDSKLCSKRLIGSCFKHKLSGSYVNEALKFTLDDETEIFNNPTYALNETIIYILDGDVSTPNSLKHSTAEVISNGYVTRHDDEFHIDKSGCLKTLEMLSRFHLTSLDDNHKGYSLFLPCFPSVLNSWGGQNKVSQNVWKSLGLVFDYLISHPDELKRIVQGLIIEDTVYSDFDQTGFEANNLNHDKVFISQTNETTEDLNVLMVNDTTFKIHLNSDVLFTHGVIHSVDKILFPDDFSISLPSLIETTYNSGISKISFMDLLNKFPELMQNLGLLDEKTSNYSLIVPKSKSLESIELENPAMLLDILKTHIIPNSQLERLLSCIYGDGQSSLDDPENIIFTNHSETVFTCTKDKAGEKVNLQLHKYSTSSKTLSTAGNTVSILSHGCTLLEHFPGTFKNMSCVFMVSDPFDLKGLEDSDGNFLHIHIGFIGVGIGIVLGIVLFGGIFVTAILCFDSKRVSRKGTEPPSHNTDHFMRVTTDDSPSNYDNGYETDIGNLINESDPLLPYANRKFYNHGALDRDVSGQAGNVASAPRKIKAVNISKALSRERNLPGL